LRRELQFTAIRPSGQADLFVWMDVPENLLDRSLDRTFMPCRACKTRI
jgi:hypothetical protein